MAVSIGWDGRLFIVLYGEVLKLPATGDAETEATEARRHQS